MQDDSMTPQTQIRLMKEFPQINTDVAKEIDIKIKTKILAYESDTVAEKDNSRMSIIRNQLEKFFF